MLSSDIIELAARIGAPTLIAVYLIFVGGRFLKDLIKEIQKMNRNFCSLIIRVDAVLDTFVNGKKHG